jgi:hypothetical protein
MHRLTKPFLKTTMQLGIVLGLITVFTQFDAFVALATNLPISGGAQSEFIEGDIPVPPDVSGQEILKKLVLGGLVYLKAIVSVVGILYITIMGFQLVMASGNEEDVTKAKRGLIYAIIAFALISMSEDLARIFDQEKGTLLESPQSILERVHLFDKEVEILMTFIKMVIGAFAALMVVRNAVSLITAGGNEEETTTQKKGILYSAGGLILLYIGDIFINDVFFKVDKNVYSGITGVHPGVDVKEGVQQLVGITNLIVSFLAPIALLMLIGGAILYATAAGNEENMEKAKRLIFATIIGILIIYGAFALVSTVISSRLTDIGALAS